MKVVIIVLLLAITWSCEDILEVTDISGEKVALLAPLNDAVVSVNKISLDWSSIEEADFYNVQLVRPNFENASQVLIDSTIKKDTIGSDIATRISGITLLNGNYEWRVKAGNSGYETSYSNAKFQINGDENIDIEAPNKPELLTPIHNANSSGTAISFSWSRVNIPGSAEKDSIYIFNDEETKDLKIKDIGANKTYATTLEASTYYWYVQSFDEAGNKSDISTVFSFTNN